MVISLYIISNNAIFYLDHNIVTHENVRLCRSVTEKTNGLHLLHLLYLPSTCKYEVIHICKWQSSHIFRNIHHFQKLMLGKKTILSKINFVKVHGGKKRYSSVFHSQNKFGVFLQSLFVKHSLAFERYIWKTCVKNQVLVDYDVAVSRNKGILSPQ